MASVEGILTSLEAKARPEQISGMARYGMRGDKRLGVAVPDMRRIAKEAGKDHRLALQLWQTAIPEAMIVASMVDTPGEVTEEQMDEWVADFNSWDVCDQVCMNLFDKTPLAWKKVHEWAVRQEEFVKRAAFALIACLAWHNKHAADEEFVRMLPVIKDGATDPRNFVKKAVSWALRSIGKRNPNLNAVAVQVAREIQEMGSQPARWVGSDALRELTGESAQKRLRPTS